MIGELIQHLLDNGFYVQYDFRPTSSHKIHRFTIRKDFAERRHQASWEVADIEVQHAMSKDLLWLYAEPRMQEIDKIIAQDKLIAEALQ